MTLPRALCLFALCISLCGPTLAESNDWPGWRGPHRDGSTAGLQLQEGQSLKIAWKKRLGSGYSGIAIAEGRAVTAFSDGEKDFVVALAVADGRILWRYEIGETLLGVDGAHDGPRSTPFLDGGQVLMLGPRGDLALLNAENGQEIWSTHLIDDLAGKMPHYGFASSPTLEGDVVLVATGNEEGGFSGLDRKTGKVLWTAGNAPVTYQSPLVFNVGGQRQLLAAARGNLWGLDPASGQVLWHHTHEGRSNRTHPLVVSPKGSAPDALVFDPAIGETSYLQLASQEMEQKWRGRTFSGYGPPVYHDGHLYGFRESFLMAVNAINGERVWRSRPPGAGFLILVDDQLVITTRKGSLHLAPASPEGYSETVDLKVFDDVSWTMPSFADGMIFMRSIDEIAAVEVAEQKRVDEASMTVAGGQPPRGAKLAELLKKASSSSDKNTLIDAYLQEQKSFPIVEKSQDGKDVVHFIYRGEAQDVGLWGDMFLYAPWHYIQEQHSLHRLEGTDFFYYSASLPNDARFEYQLFVDFEPQADSLNPRQEEDRSVLTMPKFKSAPAAAKEPRDIAGRVESFELDSQKIGDIRNIDVYLPPNYGETDQLYKVVYVAEGDHALEHGRILPTVEALLQEGRVEPFIVVLIHRRPGGFQSDFMRGRDAYQAMLFEELLPRIEKNYPVHREAAGRAMLGVMQGGIMPFLVPFNKPGVFGRVATRSVYLEPEDSAAIQDQIRNAENVGTAFYVAYGHYDWRSDEANYDGPEEHRRIAAALQEKGYHVELKAFNEGMRWGSWRHHLGEMLRFLVANED